MNCIHCGKKIERCAPCPIEPAHYRCADEPKYPSLWCEMSNEGDHEPEPEDAQ